MKYLYDTPIGSQLFYADSDDEAMKYVADLPQELQFQISRVAKVLWERKSFAMGAMDPKTYGE